MKTYTFKGKRTLDVLALQNLLRESGVSGAVVACSDSKPPCTVVYTDDKTLDPTSLVKAYSDPDYLVVSSHRPAGPDGVPQVAADGKSVHVLDIQKKDRATNSNKPGSESVQVLPSQLIAVSTSTTSLVDGAAHISIGPTTLVGELVVRVVGVGNNLKGTSIRVRFV